MSLFVGSVKMCYWNDGDGEKDNNGKCCRFTKPVKCEEEGKKTEDLNCSFRKRLAELVNKFSDNKKMVGSLTQKDKDFILYAHRKSRNYTTRLSYEPHKYSHRIKILHDEKEDPLGAQVTRIAVRILQDDCRKDDNCPFKVLLPEYEVQP